ncbi:fec operon regulator FecR [Mariniflexile rhizosphaerae]|uniref:FecR family protein n=1 Tax=unclassified Mariniflexile TaxID=2643887 RepID=UPI000CBACB62|nr:FecR domain-containing protein [Mariniflexile sp. TRM1-10]AXP81390.1 fec operon regulator FecR [Mariniflexile sp. TRM1-10]PLB18510.1 MAG: putative anti-sigma factor [Flavobacteriaceae bacterium FS1-H7996/R]
MENENNILKWFDNELSKEQIQDLKQSENVETLEKIAFYAKQMQVPQVDAQKALAAFKERKLAKKEPKVIPLNFRAFLRIAAVLVVMLASSYFLFFNNNVSFETQIAQNETLTLPDNSEVILNAASKLKYNKKTWKDKRNLELDGEAFFKVSKGKKFTVTTDIGTVQVLGTQFNVKERDNYFEVQCYEGLVSVTFKDETVKLPKGKTFRVLNGSIQEVNDFNAENPSWMQAETSFEKIPLSQVIAEFERQYDLNVSLKEVDASQLFTGTFTHKDKNIALQSITIPLKLSYRIEGNQVTVYKYEK